ncbi:YkgJ family cysteine cluster protein [Paraburkholderia susongensis]|uniref:Putative zinc-or iron-chelating domain-containing protein n=1 Tax=Paraburkholderia susongensis TaxID=1515439 RepID=A0A1X7LQ33_9BURK|nr:YkgJ family cysteine cluster protein [Paraburkholderia susongensis]SMG56026.1 Putative zinc-or iron-chelating domain-containing protein [Paraburkholderia susongensis]
MEPKQIIFRDKADTVTLPNTSAQLNVRFQLLQRKFIHNNKLKHHQRIPAIYEYVDEYAKSLSNYVVCQKGCSHCCRIDVSVTRLEAEHIYRKSRSELILDHTGTTRTTGHLGTACTFLESDGSCGIYELRPLACRTFFTLDDPKYCETNEPHQTIGGTSAPNDLSHFGQLRTWLNKWSQDGGYAPRDIRDWFPPQNQAAASSGAAAAQVAGKPSLWAKLRAQLFPKD